jgi:hypothetical protein
MPDEIAGARAVLHQNPTEEIQPGKSNGGK